MDYSNRLDLIHRTTKKTFVIEIRNRFIEFLLAKPAIIKHIAPVMKLSETKYNELLVALSPLINKLEAYSESLKNQPKTKDINKRLRWDALWASKWKVDYSGGINDNHIDTALKQAMKDLGFPEFAK